MGSYEIFLSLHGAFSFFVGTLYVYASVCRCSQGVCIRELLGEMRVHNSKHVSLPAGGHGFSTTTPS